MDDVAKTKETYQQIYPQFASRNADLNDQITQMLDHFISLLNGKRVLDIGCASGRESKYLFDKGLSVVGCDISEGFIELARKNCPECTFFVCDMRNLPAQEKYNGLWLSASFLHIPKADAAKTLAGFFKLLAEGGILYISVMKGMFDGLRANTELKWPEHHFSDYSEEELKKLLMEAGFSVLEVQTLQTDWGPTFLHFFCKK